MERSVSRKPTAQAITSAILADNTYLELVRTPDSSTSLLRWNGEKETYTREFRIGSKNFIAADLDSGIPLEMRLASKVGNYQSAAELVNGIADVLKSFAGLSSANAYLAALFAIATHFSDCHDPALRAVVNGRDEWESTQLLKLLACFCRHALSLTRFNEEHLWRLPSGCTPTFLIADPKPSRTLFAFLTATQNAEFALSRREKTIIRPFSAVILSGDNRSYDVPDSFLRIDASPLMRPELFGHEQLCTIQDRFQPQLLLYRMHHFSQVMQTPFDAPEFGGSTRALARVLGACLPDDQTLQERAVEILREQDEVRRLDFACGESAVVLDALLTLSHQGKSEAYVGEVALIANHVLKLRGEDYHVNSRRVGAILKNLGLCGTRDSRGYRFTLTRDLRRKIHELGRSYGAPFLKGEIQPCEFCKLTSGDDGL